MNLPNKLTVLRVIMIPLVIAFYMIDAIPYGKIIALGLFVIAAATDFLDGYLARKYNLVTDLGKFLDPIADKLLVIITLLMIVVDGTIPAPWGVIVVTIIIAREFIVSALRQIAATKGFVLAADMLGKIKANFQYVMTVWGFVVGGLLAIDSIADTLFVDIMKYVFYALVGITTLIVVISGIMYLVLTTVVSKLVGMYERRLAVSD